MLLLELILIDDLVIYLLGNMIIELRCRSNTVCSNLWKAIWARSCTITLLHRWGARRGSLDRFHRGGLHRGGPTFAVTAATSAAASAAWGGVKINFADNKVPIIIAVIAINFNGSVATMRIIIRTTTTLRTWCTTWPWLASAWVVFDDNKDPVFSSHEFSNVFAAH